MAVGGSGASFSLSVPADAAQMTTVRAFAAAVARRFGFDEGVIEDIKLAVSEAYAGPIDAGFAGEIELVVASDDGALRYEVRSAPWARAQQPSIDDALLDRAALVLALFDDAERIEDGGVNITSFTTASHTAAGR